MPSPRRPSLTLPAAFSVSIIALSACSSPTTPGTCVSNFVVPPDASAPPAGVQPQIDITPCAMQHTGADWFCRADNGCQVEYVGGTTPQPGAPIAHVMCLATDRCLFGLDANGNPVFGACPTLDVQPQQCTNLFRFDEPSRSGFTCDATMSGCTVSGGEPGQLHATLTRVVTGGVESSSCPTTCTPFA